MNSEGQVLLILHCSLRSPKCNADTELVLNKYLLIGWYPQSSQLSSAKVSAPRFLPLILFLISLSLKKFLKGLFNRSHRECAQMAKPHPQLLFAEEELSWVVLEKKGREVILFYKK